MWDDVLFALLVVVPTMGLMIYAANRRLVYVTTVGMHRGYTHNAFRMLYVLRLYIDYTMNRWAVWIRYWREVHRRHHRRPDTERDPHSPWGIAKKLRDGKVVRTRFRTRGKTMPDHVELTWYRRVTTGLALWWFKRKSELPPSAPDKRRVQALVLHLHTNVHEYRTALSDKEAVDSDADDLTFIDGWGRRLGVLTYILLWVTHMVPYVVVGLLVAWWFNLNLWVYLPMAGVAGIASLVIAGNVYVLLSALVNTMGHAYPREDDKVTVGHGSTHLPTARDVAGEGLQGPHHELQNSPKLAPDNPELSWRYDKGWVVVRILAWLRLIRDLKPTMGEIDRAPEVVRVRPVDFFGRALPEPAAATAEPVAG